MKNFTRILVAGAFAVPYMGTAQVNVGTGVENRNAVIEEWTGIHCGYCPTGHAAVQTAVANNPGRVVAINIHSGGYAVPSAGEPDYRTPEGTVHDGAFSISGYPSSTLNRRTIGGSQTYHPANTNSADKVPAVLAENSEVNMYMDATLDIVTRVLTVNVEYYYRVGAPNPTNYLNVAIIQNNIHGPQSDYSMPGNTYNPAGWIVPGVTYNHMHVFRGFMTGQWGTPITTTTAGSTAVLTYTQTLPANINGVPLDLAEVEIAAYIGNGFQAAGNILTGLTVAPTLTGFTATDEVIFASASMDDILSCDLTSQTLSPVVSLQNWGSNPMSTATISYNVNGGTSQNYNFSDAGNPIAPGATRMITLNPISFVPVAGNNTLNVTVSNPNGVADNTSDNTGTTTFSATLATEAETMTVTLNLVTDRYGSETTWNVKNSAGTTIASGGPYGPDLSANGTTTQAPVPMTLSANDCYTFTILDSYGDGINSGYGAGSYNIKDGNNNTLVSGGSFGAEDLGLFKSPLASLIENAISEVSIYPNPATNVLNVSFASEESAMVTMTDLQGRVVAVEEGSEVAFNVANLAKGSYIVSITSAGSVYTQNVVVQ